MKYSKKQIGEELNKELDKGYDINRIANWADNLFHDSRGDLSHQVRDILQGIFLMEAGPEFILSELELRLIARKLINDE